MRFIYIGYLIAVLVIGIFVFGELTASNFPNSKFYKWWRKNAVSNKDDL